MGATLLVKYGFANALWAILATRLIIFMAGMPISIYTASYGADMDMDMDMDMDLLRREAGFGCIGSTLTSLIYASFTFIFSRWKLLRLLTRWSWPWPWALRRAGATFFVRWWSFHWSRTGCRPPAAVAGGALVVPYVMVLLKAPDILSDITRFVGQKGSSSAFNITVFGAALTMGVALITQMGEQADVLRFMRAKTPQNCWRWRVSMLERYSWCQPGNREKTPAAHLREIRSPNTHSGSGFGHDPGGTASPVVWLLSRRFSRSCTLMW